MAIIENQENNKKPKRRRIQKGTIVAKSYVVIPKNPYSVINVFYNELSHRIISRRIEIIAT
jgi:hypothetical protein